MLGLLLCGLLAIQPPPAQPAPVVGEVKLEGVTVYRPREILDELRLEREAPLPKPPADLALALERHYHDDDYTRARVSASFDEATGTLTLTVDEGRIDEIQFEGIDDKLAAEFRDEFDVRPGDIFNTRQVRRALRRLLERTQGALRTRTIGSVRFTKSGRLSRLGDKPFDLIEDNGRRVLLIGLEPRVGRFSLTFGTDGREDWYSPVDGLALALGFNSTIFDPKRFNNVYFEGYLTHKFARDKTGYSFGVEVPLFDQPKLFVGGGLHEVTGTDDLWRLSIDEQSLVALGFKNTFRDYFDRRGYQLHAAVRPGPQHEALVAWRDEHHEPLTNEADFTFFREDHVFRPNRTARSGELRTILLGYGFDTRGFHRQSPGARLRRHQLDDLFRGFGGSEPGIRVEWTSEIADPSFGGDFDFRRHIFNARAYLEPTYSQYLNLRFLAGFSDGDLPPQRWFALGGIGSVHGYSFKEAIGDRLVLFNAEYKVELGGNDVKGLAFFDAGRVTRPRLATRDDWLRGGGVGLEIGSFRVEVGFRLDDIPDSRQVLVRFRPPF